MIEFTIDNILYCGQAKISIVQVAGAFGTGPRWPNPRPSFLRPVVPLSLRPVVPSFLRTFVPSFLRPVVPSGSKKGLL